MMFAIRLPVLVAVALTGLSLTAPTQAQQATMSFFVTSVGKGDGADLGGLARELAVIAEFGAMAPRERVHEPEARVVTGDQMLGPGIAETDDDAQR